MLFKAHQLSNLLDQQEQVIQNYNSPNNQQDDYEQGGMYTFKFYRWVRQKVKGILNWTQLRGVAAETSRHRTQRPFSSFHFCMGAHGTIFFPGF